MLPITGINLNNDINIKKYSSLSYKINEDKEEIKGKVDNEDAIRQAVYKIIKTKRYAYEIYDHDYGIELDDLFGKEKGFVKGELIGRITEALTVDDRIDKVFDFKFEDIDKTSVEVEFKIQTEFGEDRIKTRIEI